MAVVEGLFCVQTLHLGPVYLAVISQLAFLQGWPLRGVPPYTETQEHPAIIMYGTMGHAYSGTSDSGPSEEGTQNRPLYIQRTQVKVPKICFPIYSSKTF